MPTPESEIPITVFVPPFDMIDADTWSRAVGGFCNGIQVVKNKAGIHSTRLGAMVFVQGDCDNTSTLPVPPRFDTTLIATRSNGTYFIITITAGSKALNTSETDFSINGNYLAEIRRN